ncbi:amino acid permease-domain-containing protein [Podospora didyma]|uniref:Amino acid permease-domain-containing protein n=1 Tax=Podospora didyma TaxID=330526 RepID=A0AAE0NHQ8_9PEZI|nr:amino acid permease-domain-containing protein [Podospora didyma]
MASQGHDSIMELQDYPQEGDGLGVDDPGYGNGSRTPTTEMTAVPTYAPQTELKRTLKERHVNMIGFSFVLGVGLFLSAGKIIFMAGPGLAVVAYLVTGTLIWSIMATMGEMTALYPVKGPTFEFTRRFVGNSVGYASAWMLWFSYVVVCAAEILAITEIFRFKVSDEYLTSVGYPSPVEWGNVRGWDPALWVGIFLVIILLVNLLPVRQYGRLEYIFGSVKISFLVALIMINIVLSARQGLDSGNKAYECGFGSSNFTVKASNLQLITGPQGTLAAFWTAIVTCFFSMMGWEVIFLTAPENKHLERRETIKISTRKMALRIIILYSLAVLTVGFNLRCNDPIIKDLYLNGVTGGNSSAFVLAAIYRNVPFLPHFFNGFFIFSACTTGINSIYSASRILHAIASLPDAWPRWGWVESVRTRLEQTRHHVPMTAVLASWFVGFMAFMSRKPDEGQIKSQTAQRLERLTTVATTASLIVYALNCFTFLKFYKELGLIRDGHRDAELGITADERFKFGRKNLQYPYRSHLQWLRALYALIFCLLLLLFQGWRSVYSPFDAEDFVASYIAIPIFIVLSAAYFVKPRGRQQDRLHGLTTIGPSVVPDPHVRRGRLVIHGGSGTKAAKREVVAVLEWIWVWLK